MRQPSLLLSLYQRRIHQLPKELLYLPATGDYHPSGILTFNF